MNPNNRMEKNKPKIDYISYTYGLAIIIGGAIGFVKAGSTFSLAAGAIFGVASIIGAFQLSNNSKNFHVSLITATILLTVMGFRFYSSGKFMPAGLISALSLLQVVRLGVRFTESEKQQKD